MLHVEFFFPAVVETKHPRSKLSFILQFSSGISEQRSLPPPGCPSQTWTESHTRGPSSTSLHSHHLLGRTWAFTPALPKRNRSAHLPPPPVPLGYHSQNTFTSSKKHIAEQIYTHTFSEFKRIHGFLYRDVNKFHSTTKKNKSSEKFTVVPRTGGEY